MTSAPERPATTRIRWSGLVLVLGGITLALHYLTHPGGETAQYAFDPLWVPSHWLGGIGYLLVPLGLLGLYARQSREMGRAGTIGLVLTFVGCALAAGASIFLSVVLIPFLAVQGLDWMDPPNGVLYASSSFRLATGSAGLASLVGLLLLAVATLRARVIPALGAWLVILTIPLAVVTIALVFFIGTSLQGLLQAVSGVVLGTGLTAWGWALWSERDQKVGTRASVEPRPA